MSISEKYKVLIYQIEVVFLKFLLILNLAVKYRSSKKFKHLINQNYLQRIFSKNKIY